jgi:hypothetical protein
VLVGNHSQVKEWFSFDSMHTSLLLGLVTTFFWIFCNGELSKLGFCSNPWSAAHTISLDTCWLQETTRTTEILKSNFSTVNNSTEFPDSPPYPWTHHPFCNFGEKPEKTFCVHTTTTFASGRGICFIGTSQSVQLISRNRVFHTTSSLRTYIPPYEVRHLPGRGYGLIANKTLFVEDEIMAHTPVIAVQAVIEDVLPKEEIWKLFRVGVERLPQQTRNMFNALQGDAGGDEVYDRFSTNAFELYDYGAVFPETAVSSNLNVRDWVLTEGVAVES